MYKKYHVELTSGERKRIFEIADNCDTPKTLRKRCNILLLADEATGKPIKQKEIAARCGVSEVTAYQTIKAYDTKGLEYVLRRRKHAKPPRKPIVTGETEARIIALACGEPPEGFTRWTVRLLTRRVVELKIVEAIGRETVRTTLKKRSLNLT